MNGNSRYTLGAVLGAGGAGVVYEAWDRELMRPVAVKRLPLVGDAETWRREARVGARLNHPAFVAVHDAWRDEHHSHLVMERVPGRTLKDHLNHPVDGRVPIATACEWLAQAADALQSAHQQGVVHGDVKPSNLMVEPNGRVRVLDVGAASLLDPLATLNENQTGPRGSSGTLDYMAPEQLRGEPASAATDLYALGLVLYEVLHGQPAFGRLSGMTLAYHKLNGTASPQAVDPSLPPTLAQLLRALLAAAPDQRPASMAAVARTLRSVASDPPVHGGSPHSPDQPAATPSVTSWRRPGWARYPWLAAIAASLAVAAGVAWWRVAETPPRQPPTVWIAEQLSGAEAALKNYDDPGSLEDASQRLQALLERAPHHAAGAALRAITLCLQYTQGPAADATLREAGQWARQAVQADAQLAVAHVAQGLHVMLSGDRVAAEAAYRRALALDPRSWPALLWLADLLVASRRAVEAQALLDTALRLYPDERLFHDVQGTLHHGQGHYTEAEAAFRRSLALKPTGSLAYTNLSDALARQGRSDEALAVLQQGLLLRPHHRLYMHLGNALYDRGRFADAAEAYERGLASLPAGQPDAWLQANRGDALSRVPGREAQARESYQRALTGAEALARRYTANPTFASRAGLYAARLQQAPSAAQWTDTALALAPDSPDVLFRAALAAALLGQGELARERLARALARGYPAALAANEPALAALAPGPGPGATPTTTSNTTPNRKENTP